MSLEIFESPEWYRAVSLAERAAALRAETHASPAAVPRDARRAERLLRRWREQPPFAGQDYLDRRLAADGLDGDAFRMLLGEGPDGVDRLVRQPLAWLNQLSRAYAPAEGRRPGPAVKTSDETGADELGDAGGFLNLVEPLLADGLRRLDEGVAALLREWPEAPVERATVGAIFSPPLRRTLVRMLGRTLTLELNVSRLRGELAGETPQERFRCFTDHLREPKVALALLSEYPVLARQALLAVDQWVSATLEFLTRLCAGWGEICAAFGTSVTPGPLVGALCGAGDRHCRGRAVLVARFRSGLKLVYKPRSLAAESHFQQLLAWLNARGAAPALPLLRVLDCGDHGWVEYVEPRGCASRAEVARFYQRQGAYLALLHAMQATDLHSENLIACGEYPILIDLETLFHPPVHGQGADTANDLAAAAIRQSVLRVGLLPQRFMPSEETDGVDISGLGGGPGQLTPDLLPTYADPGTDFMRLERMRLEMPAPPNRPTLGGGEVDLAAFTDDLIAGFEGMYRLLLDGREELLAVGGPVSRFEGVETRVVLRPTRTYALMLQESFHPDLLRDALARDLFFDRLWQEAEQRPHLEVVIASEQADLRRGDIPLFTTRAGSRDLLTSDGRRLQGFLAAPGLDAARERLSRLGPDDLETQLWVIRSSLTSLADARRGRGAPSYKLEATASKATPEQFLEAARRVGDRLCASARVGRDDVTWLNLGLVKRKHWAPTQTGPDLYDGAAGIGLFLAYLGEITGEDRYTRLARSALATVRASLSLDGASTSIGFAGLGGLIYYLSHMGALWGDSELLAEASRLVRRLPPSVARDGSFDIIEGAAGCIGGLTALYHVAPAEYVLEAVSKCGEHLIRCAETMEAGLAWNSPFPTTSPLTGFAHGAAGIAWALFEAHALTGDARFRATALAGLEYERSQYSAEVENWPDLRDLGEGEGAAPRFIWAWCYGAPGIGLARLASLPHHDDEAVRADITAALRSTLARGFGLNHSLCHGDFGNCELLLLGSRLLPEQPYAAHAHRVGAMLLACVQKYGYACGVPAGIEVPGLMSGLAGIGYELLRLTDPESVPSVLTLEPPRAKVGGGAQASPGWY